MKILIVTAMYPTPQNPAFGSFVRTQVEALKRENVDVELMVLQGRARKLIYPKGVIQLQHHLNDPSFDLVHAHYGLVGMVARTQLKVPVVVTFHGDDVLGTVNAVGKHTALGNLVAAAGRMLSRLVDAVIVQSREMADKLKHANVYVIPHEVDLQIFRPMNREHARAALKLSFDKKYLLFAANPEIAVKRFPLAKSVAEHLRTFDPNVELLVVYKETQDRLAMYMNACDALVFPSYQEGSPNVIKQAMACNLPIVASDVGDVREVLANTARCYICDPTVEQFAKALHVILRNNDRTVGRERVRHLDQQSVARRVIAVYADTLKSRQSGRKRIVQEIASSSPAADSDANPRDCQ